MKEAHLKKATSCVIPDLWHSWKAMGTVGQWLPGVSWEGRMTWQPMEHRGCLGRWNCSAWHYNGRCVSSHMCPNPQKVPHQEWPCRQLWTLGNGGMSVQVHPSERMCHLVGMLAVRPCARGQAGGRCAGSSAPSRVRCEPKTALKNKVY